MHKNKAEERKARYVQIEHENSNLRWEPRGQPTSELIVTKNKAQSHMPSTHTSWKLIIEFVNRFTALEHRRVTAGPPGQPGQPPPQHPSAFRQTISRDSYIIQLAAIAAARRAALDPIACTQGSQRAAHAAAAGDRRGARGGLGNISVAPRMRDLGPLESQATNLDGWLLSCAAQSVHRV
ncbi:hypothetical protein JYU34_019815 [Plutella xylostella]|uniref:Uncharacterized protein n=1 Tax=Plutella xylostella TaxID=51655 RepID=A0ABQ7PVB3_PLUXY|nr:hypothetical protein JYU34_019815 [Plutella xylostella]